MREIRFRAWDKKQSKMSKPFGLDMAYIFDDGKLELMQFTGLQDMYNTDIYEGDICRNGDYEIDAHAYNYRVEVVRYIDNEGAFHGWNYNVDGMTCEVIGNVFENPDLLEPKSTNAKTDSE